MCSVASAGDSLSGSLSAKQHPSDLQNNIKECHHQHLLKAVQEGKMMFSIMFNVVLDMWDQWLQRRSVAPAEQDDITHCANPVQVKKPQSITE